MDRIGKALAKLTPKERGAVKRILRRLSARNLQGLDIKKLKGRDDIFRVRRGGIRIIYRMSVSGIAVLAIERRSEATYRL